MFAVAPSHKSFLLSCKRLFLSVRNREDIWSSTCQRGEEDGIRSGWIASSNGSVIYNIIDLSIIIYTLAFRSQELTRSRPAYFSRPRRWERPRQRLNCYLAMKEKGDTARQRPVQQTYVINNILAFSAQELTTSRPASCMFAVALERRRINI
jgi:hypothetical protein